MEKRNEDDVGDNNTDLAEDITKHVYKNGLKKCVTFPDLIKDDEEHDYDIFYLDDFFFSPISRVTTPVNRHSPTKLDNRIPVTTSSPRARSPVKSYQHQRRRATVYSSNSPDFFFGNLSPYKHLEDSSKQLSKIKLYRKRRKKSFLSILKTIAKNGLTKFAIFGIFMLLAGIVTIAVCASCPHAVAIAFAPAVSVTGAHVISSIVAGIGFFITAKEIYKNNKSISHSDTKNICDSEMNIS
ncbi:MAG: hypothetical protein P1U74_08180 [Legionellaceae bacterium]|nr:hypothetical protein [Legionellaceae bacterium]